MANSLEPGKFADFIVVDPSRFGPIFDPYASLVFVTDEQDLERVYVGGELLVDHSKVLKHDRGKVKAEVDRRVALLRKGASAQRGYTCLWSRYLDDVD